MRHADRKSFILIAFASLIIFASPVFSQSTSQDYPTPVTTTEITGTIKARDIGDARLTSYYYQFDGSQGDLFINIVTRNFTGDIDVFTQTGLRPLTKIVVYADFAEQETGRVIYLRKPEKMILRVQGRTPGDDAAQFRIKFAGSFVASTLPEPAAEPSLPAVTAKNESGIRVNSVGTIVEVIPKATPSPKPVETAAAIPDEKPDPVKTDEQEAEVPEKKIEDASPTETATELPEKKVGVVVTDNLPEKTELKTPPRTRSTARRGRRTPPATTAETPAKPPTTTPPRTARSRRSRAQTPPAEPKPDPLEKVNLVILFKDATTISRPMSEVLRFTVDKGILTVIAKDGSIGRYSILDVAKVTIE